MMKKAFTVPVRYVFRVSEGDSFDSTPSIYGEPCCSKPCADVPLLAFELKLSTTPQDAESYARVLEEAESYARFLNDMISEVRFTFWVKAPLRDRLREWWRRTSVRSVRYALARWVAAVRDES